MTPQVRYQVFVSSTYDDLREERQQVTQAILEAGSFPAGMELFPASDDSQWKLIKRVISESDYYVVVVGGRYGSIGPTGKSYTEMEYDYAQEIGVPVLGFVRKDVSEISVGKSESTDEGREKLHAFREKVMSKTCRLFETPDSLGMAVLKSLMSEARVNPRTGWTRADRARTDEDVKREMDLATKLELANSQISELERKVRDRTLLVEQLSIEDLAQGEDKVSLSFAYIGASKTPVLGEVALSYDEIFSVIGPSMYGYILKRAGNDHTYLFENDLCEAIRPYVLSEVKNKKITLRKHQVDKLVLQFKELGLIHYEESKQDNGSVFRGITLTLAGERKLTELSITKR